MANIKIACPSCGRSLQVADALAGTQVRCPECHARYQVPDTPAWRLGPEVLAGSLLEADVDVSQRQRENEAREGERRRRHGR